MKLPNVIVILIGEQFLMEDPLFVPSAFERKIKWILGELEFNINMRKSNLPQKAYLLGEPRIMWVQAFRTKKGSNLHPDQLTKYNNLLKRTCAAKAVYTIPIDDSSLRCFDFDGKTQIAEGFKFLWCEISKWIKFHDEKDREHEINQCVDERLKEMDFKQRAQADQRNYTFQSLQRNVATSFSNSREADLERNNSRTSGHSRSRSRADQNHYGGRNAHRSNDRREQSDTRESTRRWEKWDREDRSTYGKQF